jgi:hypothetical protein
LLVLVTVQGLALALTLTLTLTLTLALVKGLMQWRTGEQPTLTLTDLSI